MGDPYFTLMRDPSPTSGIRAPTKFPTAYGVVELWGDQALARHCYIASLKEKRSREALLIEGPDATDEGRW